jgi:uncharacterized protein YyaL (SSP411 family)
MLQEDGQLFRIWKNGIAHTNAFLDDYANLILAFTDLAETEFEEEWLLLAGHLCDYVNEHFYDASDGLYFYNAGQGEQLIARKKEMSDNVIPSSNARMALALHRLARLLGREDFMDKVKRMTEQIRPMLQGDLRYVSEWMQVVLLLHKPAPDIVLLGPEVEIFRKTCEQWHLPGKSLFGSRTNSLAAILKDKPFDPEKTLAWICTGNHCLAPVDSASVLSEILRSFRQD